METNTFGWELILSSVQLDNISKEKVLVIFIHWSIIKKRLKCIGIGDEKTLLPNETGSELLPDGWDKSDKYSLRYVFEDNVFILHGIKFGNTMIFNLLDGVNLNTSNIAIDIDKSVVNLTGPLKHMIPTFIDLTSKLESSLFQTILNKSIASTEVQTDMSYLKSEKNKELSSRSKRESPQMPSQQNVRPDARLPYPNIGESDLNPFGGMLFDPLRVRPRYPLDPGIGAVGGLPRGSVPPGARFDPFAPNYARRNVPDADHFIPPGYDDMFM